MLQIGTHLKVLAVGSVGMKSSTGCLCWLFHLIEPCIYWQVQVEPSIPPSLLICNQVYYWQCTTMIFFNVKVILCSTSAHVGWGEGNNLLVCGVFSVWQIIWYCYFFISVSFNLQSIFFSFFFFSFFLFLFNKFVGCYKAVGSRTLKSLPGSQLSWSIMDWVSS